MSVRNQYARNYSKITPFPPSNKVIADARIVSRKSNNLKYSPDKKIKNDNETLHGNTGSEVMLDKSKKIVRESTLKTVTNIDTKSEIKRKEKYIENNSLVKPVRKVVEGIPVDKWTEYRGTTQGVDRLTKLQNETSHRTEMDFTNEENKITDIDEAMKDVDCQVSNPLRPKSARPESRWERRIVESFSDDNEPQNKPSRPKSARPESRLMRMAEAHAQSEFGSKADLPPRPKTSYGRRSNSRDETDAQITIVPNRPKSRIGNYTRDIAYDTDEGDLKPKKRDRKSKHKSKVESEQCFRHQESDIILQSPQDDFKVWRSKTVSDLNSGIDDIDLDVDPVLYFMQDDSIPIKSVVTRHSLSKDTIEFIGNANLPRQAKAAISYHGNYLDKHEYATGKTDHYHRNRVSVQNPLPDSNRMSFNNERRSTSKGDSLMTGKIRAPFTREVPLAEAKPEIYRYSKSNRPRELTNEYRGQQHSEVTVNGQYPRSAAEAKDNRNRMVYRRPRRLQPITPVFNNNA